jgi:phosphoserine aminotransferase
MVTSRNFSAGPSHVPRGVLERALSEFLDYDGTGLSFMELSHRERDGPVQRMLGGTQALVRRLLGVPPGYEVLFFQGGAHAQFSAVPLNLMGGAGNAVAGYVDTGQWSRKAMAEAERSGFRAEVIASSGSGFPPVEEWERRDDLSYIHVCANETITGIEMLDDPDIGRFVGGEGGGPVLVGDFTSTLMSRPVDVSKYGVIYASSGKNLGPAGYTLVIVRGDLLDRFVPTAPPCLLWKEQARTLPVQNVYNTPPTYTIRLSSMVLEDLESRGGLEAASERARLRSKAVYDRIDGSGGFYASGVDPGSRSLMNIPFRIVAGGAPDEALEREFVRRAAENGMRELAGHPLAGGLRATLYNSIPVEWAEALARFMGEFEAEHRGRE